MKPTLAPLLVVLTFGWLSSAVSAADAPAPATPAVATAARPNVLFIAIDDQNDWVGALGGHPQAKTPHIDALAARGTLFLNAHCQAPLCNPSRASLLTGLRPSTTGIHGLAPGLRNVETTKQRVTLPQHFRQSGYWAFGCGKIYHDGSIPQKLRADEFDLWGPSPGMPKPPAKIVKQGAGNHPLMDWGVFPENDEDQADWKIASAAIDAMRSAPTDKPFFIACGFRLPHVPCYASQKWFDLYPNDNSLLPPVQENERAALPSFSWYLHWKLPEPRLSAVRQANQWLPHVRAYLACTSFMDSQVGRVLAELKASGKSDNTIIVLWSDHGYHLGEKEIFGKNTLWERSARVPLIFAGPGVPGGQKVARPAELLDIYPTLIDLLNLPPRDGLEGHSLLPQIKDPAAPRPWPAITTHNQGNHAIRTERYRYIHYADGSEELYDMHADPHEFKNLAKDPAHATTLAEHRKWLPKVDVPAAPGSQHRVLTKGENGQWIWEGKAIDVNDPQK